MLFTLTTTHQPATDLGYLLVKNPFRAEPFETPSLSFGKAYVFYPEATEERCTAALLLDVDPVGLVRGRQGPAGEGGLLRQYVNDRPYVASSFLSVAISAAYRSAMTGKLRERPELADAQLPLEARIAVLPARGGEPFLRRLFEPLGYEVTAEPHPLDETRPDWTGSPYFTVTLRARCRVRDLLTHLYVLIPVLDNEKHYWVGDDEVDKLLRHGAGWLAAHPGRDLIARRYLKRRWSLVREALERLSDESSGPEEAADATLPGSSEAVAEPVEETIERRISLNEHRQNAVLAALKDCSAKRVLDLGCGEGRLIRTLLEDRAFEQITGMDVSYRSLEIAQDRLRLDRMPPMQRERVTLLHGSLIYRDRRLEGYDAAAVVEVIEHLDPPRLAAFERSLFEFARPRTVVVTTPNSEYNVRWETLPAGQFRHRDHRFEWSRAEFQAWSEGVAARFAYSVRFLPVGPDDPEVGPPTQMGVFTLEAPAHEDGSVPP